MVMIYLGPAMIYQEMYYLIYILVILKTSIILSKIIFYEQLST